MPTTSYLLATVSPQFVVNATTANDQFGPDVAMLSNGDLFFTFSTDSPSNVAHQDAMFRRFSTAGIALDANDGVISAGIGTDDEERTNIAILSDGNIVIVNEDNGGGSDDDVEFHLLTGTGSLLDGNNIVTQAEGQASDGQFVPQVAALAGGGFVVVYYDEFAGSASNSNAELVIFNNDGSLRAGPVIAGGATTALAVLDATVTALTNGNFVVAFRQDIGGGDFNVRFRILNANGVALGSEVTVSTDLDDQSQPVMAALPGGGFALVLRDEVNGSATNTELELRIYNSSGAQVGTTQTWNPGAFDLMSQPDIALISNNLLLVSHTSDRSGNSDIFGQLATLDGTLVGAELNLAVGSGTQSSSALASIGASGRFAMAWADDVAQGGDASGFHVSGQVRQVLRFTSGDGGDEVLTGDDLRDGIRGNGGNDVIDGGTANDSATYAGNVGSYRFDFLGADNLRITDLRPGSPDGADTLRAIEDLVFADAVLSVVVGTSGDDNIVAGSNRAINAGVGNDTLTLDFALVDATVSFAGNAVLIESGANHIMANGFETFVFADGTVQNNDGSPLIDDLFYYSRYHDVWNAHVDADAHYNASGWHERRDPNAFFSTSFYLTLNPDVAAAGVNPLAHFDANGWQEGRVGSIAFSAAHYRAANPDVAAAQVDPLAHFLASGAQEGRVPFAWTELFAANGFDYVHYLQHNPDVAAAGVDPLLHFQTFGWQEGRDPNALFDVSGYLAAYADVAAAHVNPFDHYDQFGRHEGRDPSVNFDTASYLAAYPDVAAAGVNPLTHYLQLGIHEGRSAFADGVFG